MTSHTVARIIEVAVCCAPFVGVPLLVWRDPSGIRDSMNHPSGQGEAPDGQVEAH